MEFAHFWFRNLYPTAPKRAKAFASRTPHLARAENSPHTSHPCSEQEPEQMQILMAVPRAGILQGKNNSKWCREGFLRMNLG